MQKLGRFSVTPFSMVTQRNQTFLEWLETLRLPHGRMARPSARAVVYATDPECQQRTRSATCRNVWLSIWKHVSPQAVRAQGDLQVIQPDASFKLSLPLEHSLGLQLALRLLSRSPEWWPYRLESLHPASINFKNKPVRPWSKRIEAFFAVVWDVAECLELGIDEQKILWTTWLYMSRVYLKVVVRLFPTSRNNRDAVLSRTGFHLYTQGACFMSVKSISAFLVPS